MTFTDSIRRALTVPVTGKYPQQWLRGIWRQRALAAEAEIRRIKSRLNQLTQEAK